MWIPRDLGKMSFGILHAFLSRLRSRGLVPTLPELETALRQFQVHDNQYQQVVFEIPEEERPPMIEVPAYREKRQIET